VPTVAAPDSHAVTRDEHHRNFYYIAKY